jgi:hypothetical protein
MGDSMSTIINATTTNGVVIQPDNSGSLVLQTNSGTTALTIDTSQRAAFVAGTAALPAITTTGDTNTGMFFPAADTIAFAEGGAEAMRLDSSGNVGIGNTSPSYKLSVNSSNGINSYDGVAGRGRFVLGDPLDPSGYVGMYRGNAGDPNTAGNDLSLGSFNVMTFRTGAASFGSQTERMRITSTGGISFGSSGTAFGTTGQVLTSQGNAAPIWAAASSIGVGQTWQNVAGSRVAGTTYTNSTGNPIQVLVTPQVSGNNTAGNATAEVSGLTVARMIANCNNASYTTATPLSFIVPNGATYRIVLVGAPTTIIFWTELR